jgi:hypothetical protein
MEKGFNDDELADIMSEIESLEQEFTDDQPEQVEASSQEEVEQTDSVEEQPEQEEVVSQQEHEQEEPQVEEHQEEVVAQQEEPEHRPEPVVAKEEHQDEIDEEMNEVLGELSEMPVEDVVPQHKVQSYDDNIHHMKQEPVKEKESWSASHGQPAQTSMSFRVEGEMKLDLNFSISGQDVNLQVTDHGFEIELAGGAKFTLPLGSQHQGKKVA